MVAAGRERVRAITLRLTGGNECDALATIGDDELTHVRPVDPGLMVEMLAQHATITARSDEQWGMYAFANQPGSLFKVRGTWIVNALYSERIVRIAVAAGRAVRLCPAEFGPAFAKWQIDIPGTSAPPAKDQPPDRGPSIIFAGHHQGVFAS